MGMCPPRDLIVHGWVATVPAASGVEIGSQLPAPETWTGQFYITSFVYLSQTSAYTPFTEFTAQIDVWGKSSTDQTVIPPWNATARLATDIEVHAHECGRSPGLISAPVGTYDQVRVRDVAITSGFVRVDEADPGLARYRGSIRFAYIGE